MVDLRTGRFARAGVALILGTVAAAACAGRSGEAGTAPDARDEQVRIGYGSQDRAEVTGAIAWIEADELGREITSFEDLFQGVAGVTVRHLASGGISLRIRGSSSLSSDAEPLYVINGVPMRSAPGQALMGVNPRDITRIAVLKDAGATSIYGSRGANGVILIFTRRRDGDPPL